MAIQMLIFIASSIINIQLHYLRGELCPNPWYIIKLHDVYEITWISTVPATMPSKVDSEKGSKCRSFLLIRSDFNR